MDKNITALFGKAKPVFDDHIPPPRKGKAEYLDAKHSYLVGQRDFHLSYGLSCMEVGQSCLLSNWATTSISYVQNKTGFQFQRQLQPDGSVRVWRIK